MYKCVQILSCLFFSWKPSTYRWCNSDKIRAGGGFFVFFMGVAWIALFIWSKAEFLADFTWYITFSPWWSIAIVCFGVLVVSWIIFIGNTDSSDFKVYAALIVSATVAIITLCAFLVLLVMNLNAIDYDQPTYPWILVATPLIIFEGYSICACCILVVTLYK